MKRYFPLIASLLLCCLLIYAVYRSTHTVVNRLFIAVFSRETFMAWKAVMAGRIPLSGWAVYSLPEGLWVFCITVLSRFCYIDWRGARRHFTALPLVFSLGLEILQALHVTNGRFDWIDVGTALLFWLAAIMVTNTRGEEVNVRGLRSYPILSCAACYGIVYLAHVSPGA